MKHPSLSAREKQKYDKVFAEEVEKLKKRKSVKAILIGGSYARNALTHGSDLDFVLLVEKGREPKEERYEVEGIPVEHFSLTELVAKKHIEKEHATSNRFISGVLAGCRHVSGDKKLANKIIVEAKKSLRSKVPKLSSSEKVAFLFFLSRSPLQEERIGARGQNVARQLRMNHKLYTCFELAHRFEQIPVPSYKHWDDRLSYLKDRKMARLLSKTILASTKTEHWNEWSKLVVYTSELLRRK